MQNWGETSNQMQIRLYGARGKAPWTGVRTARKRGEDAHWPLRNRWGMGLHSRFRGWQIHLGFWFSSAVPSPFPIALASLRWRGWFSESCMLWPPKCLVPTPILRAALVSEVNLIITWSVKRLYPLLGFEGSVRVNSPSFSFLLTFFDVLDWLGAILSCFEDF